MTPDENNPLNWNLLRTFFVIAQEKSITRAAKRLEMRQPSVSTALQKLEEQLNCQLAFRDSRRFELTLRGAKIYQECLEIFQSVDRIGTLSEESQVEEHGEVRLQIISNLVSPLVDEALRLFHHRSPSVTFNIEVQNSQTIVHNIRNQHVGLGICLLTKPIFDLQCQYLFREEFNVFCGAEHALYGKEMVTIRQLQQEPFIAFSCATEGVGLEPMVVLRESARLGSHVSGASPNLEEVRRMIVSGLGIGILPLTSVKYEVENGQLWPLRISDRAIGADVFLVRNPQTQLSGPEQRFCTILEELLQLYPELT